MTRKTISTIPTDKGRLHPVPTPDGSKVAIVSPDKKYVAMHETATGQKLSSFEFTRAGLAKYAFSPGGRYLLVLEALRRRSVWDVVDGKQVGKVNLLNSQSMQISPDGAYLLLCDNKTLYLYDFAALKQVRTYAAPFGGFESGGFSPDSKLVYATWSGRVGSFDRETGSKVMEYKPKGRAGRGVWVSPDHQFMIVQGTIGNNVSHCDAFRVGQPEPIAKSTIRTVAAMGLGAVRRDDGFGDDAQLRDVLRREDIVLSGRGNRPERCENDGDRSHWAPRKRKVIVTHAIRLTEKPPPRARHFDPIRTSYQRRCAVVATIARMVKGPYGFYRINMPALSAEWST